MDIALNIFTLALGGTACAAFVMYLRECMEPGMIFGGWLPWVARHLLKETPELRAALNACPTKEEMREVLLSFAADQTPLIKPLGLCIKCFLPWVAVPYFSLMYFGLPWAMPWYMCALIFLSFSVGALRLLLKFE